METPTLRSFSRLHTKHRYIGTGGIKKLYIVKKEEREAFYYSCSENAPFTSLILYDTKIVMRKKV